MACAMIHTWTFTTLVGAFLDLGLSYLLLCCSALAYIAAKFLGFFGLYLPCPCNGLFGDPDGTKCLQRLLVDAPSRKISSVQMSVRTRFPFDSIWSNTTDYNGRHLVEFVNDKTRGGDGGVLEIQGGEESCSSFSEAQNSRSFTVSSSPVSRDERVGSEADVNVNSCSARRGRSDGKGKGILHQKPPSGLRRRRRASAAVVHGKFSAVSSSSDATPPPRPLQMVGERGIEKFKERLSRVNSDDAEDMPMGVNLIEGDLPSNGSNGLLGENEVMDKYSSFVEELVRSARCGDLGKEANAIRVLEQALEEEHASSTALYVELEKERSAAASAADEAMAMILRLQEEKALIEMEARQYQRLIEEKSAYDEEEMNILKEILVRREREKHFLEKEVEAYRKMILSGRGHQLSEDDLRNMLDISGERPCSSFDSSEDPMMLMLQQLSESIGKKEIGNDVNRSPQSVPSAENRSTLYVFGNESPSLVGAEDVDFIKREDSQRMGSMDKHYPHVQECIDEVNVEFQEKGMVSMDVGPSTPQDDGSRLENDSIAVKLMDGPREGGLHDETFLWANGHRQKDEPAISQEAAAEKGDNACSGVDFGISQFDMESSIHDVHVVDDKQNMVGGKESELLQTVTVSESSNEGGISLESSVLRKIDVLSDHPSSSRVATEEHIHRSRSDTAARFLPRDGSRGKVSFSDSRRTSLSEVDYERLKLETEVGRLTERLRIVQEGREKLTFSVGHRERENFQLQLLEEIASQLREIRSLTEPGKAARQASLPPPSSKANSKKRRCRSMSWGVRESS